MIRGNPGAVSARCWGIETSAEDRVGPPRTKEGFKTRTLLNKTSKGRPAAKKPPSCANGSQANELSPKRVLLAESTIWLEAPRP